MPSFVSNIQCFWDGVFCCLKRSAADEEEKVVERQKKLAHHLEAPFPSYGTDCTSAENSQGPHVPPLNISNQVPPSFLQALRPADHPEALDQGRALIQTEARQQKCRS